jgi:hypothetical protein
VIIKAPVSSRFWLVFPSPMVSSAFVFPAENVVVETAVLVAGHEEGWNPDHHVVRKHAQTPVVGRLAVGLSLENFWGHVYLLK